MAATRRWQRLICSCMLIFSGTVCANGAITPLFYHVSYQGKTAWVLGSFHVGKAEFYPLPTQIREAYARAGALVLEVDVRDPSGIGLMRQYGMTPQTPDAETRTVLNRYCADKTYCEQFKGLSPWLQAMQFTLLRLTQQGYSANYGTETQLMQQLGQRPLLALESYEQQFAMLASLELDAQWAMVRDALSSPNSELDRLVNAWKSGDAATLQQISEEDLQQPGGIDVIDKVLWQRNRVMADGIARYLDSAEQPLFVAIGAAHLVGERSVLALLQQAGATTLDCNAQQCP
ncbi:TraB/GumN family protein [Shewanella avicenniae]|uniref:TraB/GumN family protein n=1 Tax=Shewanella avicenniae TaxID=2814294 RepID=A0ABX7QQQ8_9GAMM|nr:TraB/GumN family protein [Shewanella avicenniae]QSX33325.1 TraB/GumN family protein [Shewanella avicenniae]